MGAKYHVVGGVGFSVCVTGADIGLVVTVMSDPYISAVKALEDVKSNGNTCDDEVDTVLANAEKRALEKLNNASKVPSRALPHGQLIGGMAGPHDMKPITGSGLVLNALATSRGLSQLVNSVTPSDHSYTSSVSGLPGATANFKPELTSAQPSVIKSNVRNSLVALSSSLRSGGPTPLSLSTSTTGGAQMQTRSAVPLAMGMQGEPCTAVTIDFWQICSVNPT